MLIRLLWYGVYFKKFNVALMCHHWRGVALFDIFTVGDMLSYFGWSLPLLRHEIYSGCLSP